MEAIRNCFRLAAVIYILFDVLRAERTVTTKFLVPPEDMNSTVSIAHIQAVGGVDALHYLITTLELPTILVVRTSRKAEISIDWPGLLSGSPKEMAGSIKFGTPQDIFYSYGVAFTRLIDYNDVLDKSDLRYGSEYTLYNLTDFVWENMTAQSDELGNMVLINANSSRDDGPDGLWTNNGSITFKFNAYDYAGREPELPHLEFNDNITQFSLSIDHVWTNYTKSRFGIEMAIIGHDTEAMYVDESRSIDDEYSPGVFEIHNLKVRPSDIETGFVQWKPVCYMHSARSRRDATSMKYYDFQKLDNNNQDAINRSIIYAFYGDTLMHIMRTSMNVSFGLTKDGGYNKTQYLSWSASIGYGTPPEDVVSTLVIIVISIGLGLPVVIIIGGSIFVCVKKRKEKVVKVLQDAGDYQPIVN